MQKKSIQNLLSLLAILAGISSIAQETYFKSWVIPDTATVGQKVTVYFEANGQMTSFTPPAEVNFDYTSGPSRQSQTKYINGTMQYNETIRYEIVFPEKGDYKIGEATAKVNGKEYKTSSISIHTLPEGEEDQTTKKSQSNILKSEDITLLLKASKLACDLDDSIQVELCYQSNRQIMEVSEMTLPQFNGFYVRHHHITPKSAKQLNGDIMEYSGTLSRWTLYPLKTGILTIDSCRLTMNIRQKYTSEKTAFFRTNTKPVKRHSNNLEISVMDKGISNDPQISNYQTIFKNKAKPFLEEKKKSIAFAVDVSRSMTAEDFKPNRLSATQATLQDYTKFSRDDFCLIRFAKESETICGTTSDRNTLKATLDSLGNHHIPDGTAIGDAILEAMQTLSNSDLSQKHIVLITDGRSNSSRVSTITATEIATKLGIKVHIVCLYSPEPVPISTNDFFGNQTTALHQLSININELNQVVSIGKGELHIVGNQQELNNAIQSIRKAID